MTTISITLMTCLQAAATACWFRVVLSGMGTNDRVVSGMVMSGRGSTDPG